MRLPVVHRPLRPAALAALLVLVIAVTGCIANTRVLDNYRVATAFPERFDGNVRISKGSYDIEFFNCLDLVKGLFRDAVAQKTAFCRVLGDPESTRTCEEEDIPQQVLDTLGDMELVIREATPYEQTASGASALRRKEALGEEAWVLAQDAHVAVYEEFLLCR